MILCLVGHSSSFVARVSRADPTEGLCWFCEATGWTLTQPSIRAEDYREPEPAPPPAPVERPAWLPRFDRYTGFKA